MLNTGLILVSGWSISASLPGAESFPLLFFFFIFLLLVLAKPICIANKLPHTTAGNKIKNLDCYSLKGALEKEEVNCLPNMENRRSFQRNIKNLTANVAWKQNNRLSQSWRKPGGTLRVNKAHSHHNMTQRFKKLNYFLLNFYLYAICIYKSSKAISLRLRQTVRRSCVSVKSSLFVDQLACVIGVR